jgi:RecB family exonuclease
MTSGAELILSKSSIEVWLACHKRWAYGYMYRVPGAPNLDMLIGTATHAGVEAYWKRQPPYDATRRAFVYEGPLDATTTSETVVAALFDALAMTKLYIEKIAPTFAKPPTLIERDFLIRVNGTLVSGRIDCATEDPDEVRDTKTTSTPSKVTPERHQLGQTLYAWGFAAITGRMPTRLLLDCVGKNGKVAVKEVEPDYVGAAEVVAMVAKGIQEGDFRPTGAASGACYGCAYRTICPDANLGLTPVVKSAPDDLELVHEEEVPA